jgi:PAS domain S-box-containing protein
MDRVMLERIRNLLRQNPRGLHISDISARLRTSRDSISKYLEVLEVTGQVESRNLGTARVFCLTSRVPASALLDLSSDLVCTLDNRGSFLFANQKFLEFLGLPEKDLIGMHILDVRCDRLSEPVLPILFSDLLAGQEEVREVSCRKGGEECHLRMRGIPTVFEDGVRGTTVLMEDITREREYVRDLEFLARTSQDLTDMGDDEDIYQHIADRIYGLEPGSIISVTSLDSEKQIVTIRGVAGDPGDLESVQLILGRDPVGFTFPFDQEPLAAEALVTENLQQVPDLNSMLFNSIPPEVVAEIGAQISFGKGYAIGCICRGGMFGIVAILLKKGQELRHKELIETFIGQAAIALQRRHMREKLRAAEERLEALKEKPPGSSEI